MCFVFLSICSIHTRRIPLSLPQSHAHTLSVSLSLSDASYSVVETKEDEVPHNVMCSDFFFLYSFGDGWVCVDGWCLIEECTHSRLFRNCFSTNMASVVNVLYEYDGNSRNSSKIEGELRHCTQRCCQLVHLSNGLR